MFINNIKEKKKHKQTKSKVFSELLVFSIECIEYLETVVMENSGE